MFIEAAFKMQVSSIRLNSYQKISLHRQRGCSLREMSVIKAIIKEFKAANPNKVRF